MALAKGERLRRDMLRKRRANLFKKANELAGKTDSKIYVVVRNDNKFHTYKSTDNLDWLTLEKETSSCQWNHTSSTDVRATGSRARKNKAEPLAKNQTHPVIRGLNSTRHAFTAAKTKSMLRGQLGRMKGPMLLWLGYFLGSRGKISGL